jgi:hypothetical protein
MLRETGDIYVAIVEALAPFDRFELDHDERDRVAREAAEFVAGELAAVPYRLSVLFQIGLFGFRLLSRLFYGGPFCELPLGKRRSVVQTWAYGKIGLTRQFFRPLRATAFLAFYEHPVILAKLGVGERTGGLT